MLPASSRLRAARAITSALRHGQRRSTAYATIYQLNRGDGLASKVACVVSKRISASSVVRHRYQRLLRQASKTLLERFPVSMDIVVVAKPTITKVKDMHDLSL